MREEEGYQNFDESPRILETLFSTCQRIERREVAYIDEAERLGLGCVRAREVE